MPALIEDLIVNRRTVDQFKSSPPAKQTIIDAIDKARWAPNHHLTQPWHFYFPNAEMIEQIINLNASLVTQKKGQAAGDKKRERWSSIPGWLVVTCDTSSDPLCQQEDYAACCCCIYALSLILWQKEIGIKWTTGNVIRQNQFYDICWIDRSAQSVVGLIWYGFPDAIPAPQHRYSTNEIVTEF